MKWSFERREHCFLYAFSILALTCIAMPSSCAAASREEKEELPAACCGKEDCCTCTRELVTVLQGGATTLLALIVSLGKWYLTDFHFPKKRIIKCAPEVSLVKVFWTCIAGVLLPQIFMSFVLSSALCATILQQRVVEKKRRMAKRLSAMVVWIQVDEPGIDMTTFFQEHESLREFFTEYDLSASVNRDPAPDQQTQHHENQIKGQPYASPIDVTDQLPDEMSKLRPEAVPVNVRDQPDDELKKLPGAPGVQDALVLYFSRSGEMKQLITAGQPPSNTDSGSSTMSSERKTSDQYNGSRSGGAAPSRRRGYILCSQDWDPKNRLWKEAMLKTDGVLPSMEELEPIQSRTKMECVGVAIQALGYLMGIVSRWFAAGAGGSRSRVVLAPVEIISAWISILLLVQVLAIPQLVTFCSKGMFLHLPRDKFIELVDFYEKGKERRNDVDITFKTICLFVLCLFFLFGLFLILIPALVYYYYRLPHHILSFASLILFTLLSGVSIMAFVLTLIFPALQVLFTFSAFPGLRQPAAPGVPAAHNYLTSVSSAVLLVGLSAYTLAIADTVLNWHSFRARDCYFSSFVIPHVGS